MTPAGVRAIPLAAAAALALWFGAGAVAPDVGAQVNPGADSRFAGLTWTFARVRYEAWTMPR